MREGLIWACLSLLVLGAAYAATPAPAAATAELENEARLLVHKELLSRYIVESMDTVIKYSIFNIGGVTATNIVLKDPSIGPDFEVIGSTDVTFGRIPPQGNTSHTIVIKPLKSGQFNLTSAVVTYSSGENTQDVHTVYSSEPLNGEGPIYIAAFKEFDKRFSPHFLDWAAFAVMAVPPLFIPFLLWHTSKSRYETGGAAKKAK